jgi:PEP-CTERM motif
MRKSLWIMAFFLFAAIVAPTVLRADQTTYCYQGNHFTNFNNDNAAPGYIYTTSESVSGCITLAAALPANALTTLIVIPGTTTSDVLSFYFSDGLQDAFGRLWVPFALDLTTTGGKITNWDIGWEIRVNYEDAGIITDGGGNDSANYVFYSGGNASANNSGNPGGTWTVVPEPATGGLMLLGFGMIMRKLHSQRLQRSKQTHDS